MRLKRSCLARPVVRPARIAGDRAYSGLAVAEARGETCRERLPRGVAPVMLDVSTTRGWLLSLRSGRHACEIWGDMGASA